MRTAFCAQLSRFGTAERVVFLFVLLFLVSCDQNAPPTEEETVPWDLLMGRIAYQQEGKLNVLDVGTRTIRSLQEGSFPGLTWEPNGERFAFVRRHDGSPKIFRLPSAGGETAPFFDSYPGLTTLIGATVPAWSTDGRLVYEVAGWRGKEAVNEIWIDSDPFFKPSAPWTELCGAGAGLGGSWAPTRSAFSPAGDHIVVCVQNYHHQALLKMSIAAQSSTVLFQVSRQVSEGVFAYSLLTQPVHSPDGARLAFIRWRPEQDSERSMWLINTDGTDARQLTTGYVSDLTWSPDGDKILYRGSDDRLYVVPIVGGEAVAITSRPAATPSWIH
jgi:WD40 repeat protein